MLNNLLLGSQLDIKVRWQKNIERPDDIAFTEDKVVIAFPTKFVTYNLLGEEIEKVEKLKKTSSRKLTATPNKIINLLGDKHLLQVFQDGKVVKEINLKENNIIIVFSSLTIADSCILLLSGVQEDENDEKYIHHCLLRMNINTEKIDKICGFDREKFTLDYVFKQDPINEKMSNVILGEEEFIVLTKDSIEIRNFANKSLKKVEVNFPAVHIDKDIKEFYDNKKSFMMKFIYPENSPRIYKLYPLGNGKYLIDIWLEKAKRIKNKNLEQFMLYYYEDGKFSEIVTEHDPDNFMKIEKNKIAIYNDSRLTIGEIVIKEEEK